MHFTYENDTDQRMEGERDYTDSASVIFPELPPYLSMSLTGVYSASENSEGKHNSNICGLLFFHRVQGGTQGVFLILFLQ